MRDFYRHSENMDIEWLTNLIRWEECQPKGIVIDGPSFIYTFSRDEAIPWMEGGRYWVLRDRLVEFFISLNTIGIETIVMIQNEFDCSDKQEGIKIDCLKSPNCSVLPILSSEVFRALKETERGVKFKYTNSDVAARDTVAIANDYNYPVLANDSDYYTYNITAGYIPFHRFNWHARPLTAEVYKFRDFIGQFGWRQVIPAVLDNDLIEPDLINNLIQVIEEVVSQREFNEEDLIQYISKKDNVNKLISHIRKEDEITIEMNLRMAQVNKWSVQKSADEKWDMRPYGPFLFCFCKSFLARHVIDDPHKPTAQLASVGIRQSMYTMMSPLMKENRAIEIKRNQQEKGGNIEDIEVVDHEVFLSPSPTLPSVLDIEGMSPDEKLSVFCHVLGIDRNILDEFDNQWKLVIAAARYWVKECRPSEVLMKSLAATFVHCFKQQTNHTNYPNVEELLSRLEDLGKDEQDQWSDALRSFSCFQCIFFDISVLNKLLQGCLDATLSPVFFFDGKFALTCACTNGLDSMIEEQIAQDPLYEMILIGNKNKF